jgi:hypothetical protein
MVTMVLKHMVVGGLLLVQQNHQQLQLPTQKTGFWSGAAIAKN